MTCEQWPITWPCEAPPTATPQRLDTAYQAAQALLWARTGRRVGVCTVVETFAPVGGGACGVPFMRDDRTWAHGTRGGDGAVFLTRSPVVAVDEVRVYGQIVNPLGYQLRGTRLVRIGDSWPVGPDEAPTVEVAYRWGVPIVGGLYGLVAAAMGEVANEIVQGLCGGVCKLPSRAVSVTRQGVTVDLGAPGEYSEKGLLGMPIADALIGTMNPHKRLMRSRVYSPDMAQAAVLTDTDGDCVTVGGYADTLYFTVVSGGDAAPVEGGLSDPSVVSGGDASTEC
jgi:hypothetical protein